MRTPGQTSPTWSRGTAASGAAAGAWPSTPRAWDVAGPRSRTRPRSGVESTKAGRTPRWCTTGQPAWAGASSARLRSCRASRTCRAYADGLTALPDWRITCFFVDKAHRGQGVASAALKGAVDEISRLGGGTVESYPEDVAGRSVSGSFLHNATVSLFERHGFERTRRLGKNRWVTTLIVRPQRPASQPDPPCGPGAHGPAPGGEPGLGSPWGGDNGVLPPREWQMLSLRDDARADLLERAIEAAGRSGRRDDGSEDHNGLTFLQCYYRHIAGRGSRRPRPGGRLRRRAVAPRPGGQPPPGHRGGARAHPERRGQRLGLRPHRRRGGHRRHAVPRRLGHQRARPGRASAIHLVIHPQVVVRRVDHRRAARRRRCRPRARAARTPPSSPGSTSRSTGSPTPR